MGCHCLLQCMKVKSESEVAQSCPILCDPIDGSPPGSPVPRILQARTWSGLSFPSPVHEREKRRGNRSVVSNCSRPHGLQPTRVLCPWDFPGKSTGVGCHCLLRIVIWSHLQLAISYIKILFVFISFSSIYILYELCMLCYHGR